MILSDLRPLSSLSVGDPYGVAVLHGGRLGGEVGDAGGGGHAQRAAELSTPRGETRGPHLVHRRNSRDFRRFFNDFHRFFIVFSCFFHVFPCFFHCFSMDLE